MTDLEMRKQIWKCLSELYLDTELQETDYVRIANGLKESRLSIETLKEIDLYEVFPSLQINLNSAAGEWSGFNEDWLIRVCTKNYRRRRYKIFRFVIELRNKGSFWMRKKHWDAIEKLLDDPA